MLDSVDFHLVDDDIWYLHNKENAFYELSTCGILVFLVALCAARLVNQRPAGDDGVQITCQPRKCDSQEEISALSAQHLYTRPSLEMIIWWPKSETINF